MFLAAVLPVTLALVLCYCSVGSSVGHPSFTKHDGIYVRGCEHLRNYNELFSHKRHPSEWDSCNDAYSFTWKHSYKANMPVGYLSELTEVDVLKLIHSSGFCPHLRCQLGNVSNIGEEEKCPTGLCYAKLENGSPSFGACCYSDGKFNSGDLIGYYRKTQPAPKPIYKHSRIVLKPSFDVGPSLADSELDSSSKMESEVESESEISFINANEVFPGLIMTQCPLVNPTSPFQSTLSDALLMVLQQNISVWIQIMSSTDTMPHVSLHRRCYLFPLLDFKEQKLEHGLSVRNVQVHGGGGDGDGRGSLPRGSPYLEHISTPHSIDSHNDISTVPNITNITFTVIQTSTDGIVIAERCLQYLWYNNWPDFGVPRDADDKTIRALSLAAAGRLEYAPGEKIAISCMSGRGRSGTLGALIVGFYLGLDRSYDTNAVDTLVAEVVQVEAETEGSAGYPRGVEMPLSTVAVALSQLVDLIVGMRTHRDGLVELPEQFYYIRRMLGLVGGG